MIFRLEYCNKDGDTARVDIQKGDATVTTVEGTGNPFVLFYNNDKDDKSGSFRSSGADINIYETDAFNIDELKTSSETEISVKYYINSSLVWSGFVIPDFFSKQIDGSKGVVSMVASDRLGTLKGVTLSDLPAKVSNRQLVQNCLAETGLTLPLYTMADFVGGGSNFFESQVLSQRMIDTRGRSISCYDILSSILEETNSLLLQRNGAWYIINKLQLEAGSGSLYSNATTSTAWVENAVNFNEVTVGARRTIMPVAASVGVYHEHGGSRPHPDNYDFSQGLTGWVKNQGFTGTIDNRKINGYILSGQVYLPVYGDPTSNNYLVNRNYLYIDVSNRDGQPRLSADPIPIITNNPKEVKVSLDINVTGKNNTQVPVSIAVFTGTRRLFLNSDGIFQDKFKVLYVYIKDESKGDLDAVMKGFTLSGTVKADNDDDVSDYTIEVDIYGSGVKSLNSGFTLSDTTSLINSILVKFSTSKGEIQKGTIYKREQGANFTKAHDVPTVLWGDYLTGGLNGYFYDYFIDDTSSLYHPNGALHSKWTAYGDTEQLPLLQHVTRQKSRMFSVAHDLLSAEIAVKNFDPLSIFVDCAGKRYVVVSAKFDFFRSVINAELEQVAYSNNIVRDFIYSYFGEGESGVKSIGGISGGGTTGGGGGLTTEQLTILNDVNNRAHDHENKAILDEVTQEIIDNSHAHNNLSILNQITQEIINNAMREMIKENSSTPLTDENYLSSLRTIKEIAERAISKLNPDTAQEVITFLKGIEFGTYSPGLLGSGGKIDGNGNGELRGLRLWETLEVPELRYNRAEVFTGIQWQTFGAGIIESVEIDKDAYGHELQSGIIHLKLEEGEIGKVAFDDMCMGIYHNFGGPNDTVQEDQRNGNFRMKGFWTSYFRIDEILEEGTNKSFHYVLRGTSERWNQLNHPQPFMHFACYSNPTNPDRQACMYTTTEYSIRLRNMTTWEYGEANIYAIEGKLEGFSLGDNVFTGTGQVIGNGYFYGYIQTINIPDIVQDEIDSIKEDTKNINTTFFSKPDKYKKGDSWVLLEDTVLNNVYYEKGQILQSVYETGTDSDWRLVQLEDEAKTTDGINLVRNYDLRYGLTHWGGVGEIGELTEADVIPTEFYEPTINVLGDEYGYEYAITTDNDELLILDE